jgi:pentatricopeptide repeat protein
VVYDLGITPDEGICIHVLHTAGRHGLPDLASDALRILKYIGTTLQEYHFAPVIESFCVAKKMKEAFGVLHIMRNNGIAPTMDSADPIFRVISRDIDAVDEAWALLNSVREAGENVDVIALDVLVKAAVQLGDLQRAVGTYQTYPEHGAKPTVDTFNLLFQGCVAAKHRELGDRFLKEMTINGNVKPNVATYEQVILLCLTQKTYEDAFFYLEEMKGPGSQLRPTRAIYEAIIKRCVQEGDERYKLARSEMRQCGYHEDPKVTEYIGFGGRDGKQVEDEPF